MNMTEQDWLECVNPKPMLGFLGSKASERKRRLFDVACCEELSEFLVYPESKQAIEVARRRADGLVTAEELLKAEEAAERADNEVSQAIKANDPQAPLWATTAVWVLLIDEPNPLFLGTPHEEAAYALEAAEVDRTRGPNPLERGGLAPLQVTAEEKQARERGRVAAQRRQADLLRELFGNPFRPSSMQPAWRTQTVNGMAQHIYDDGTFGLLPVLADALEEAGCTDQAILSHLRGPGPHVRGCWALDLVLGRSWMGKFEVWVLPRGR
jgi:hypothetical protein